MIEETDRGVSQVKHPPKEAVVECNLIAQENVKGKSMTFKKFFLEAGIGRSSEELMRDNSTYMSEVFGEKHSGYVELG